MKRVALAALACLLLSACRAGTSSPGPSASLPVTDLSSFRLPSPTLPPPPETPTPAPTKAPTTAPTPTPSPTTPPATPVPSPPSTPLATALTAATPFASCVQGWVGPTPESAQYAAALAMIESQMGVTGPWIVDEMRYFTGPDVPWIIDPHYDVVDYWYVKATRTDEQTFRGRWLLEQRTDTIRGISAVAPFDTIGYASPDWTGFTGEGTPQIVTGLPGTWAGIPYDFVTGEGDSGQPGLPDQVIGCLSGT